MRGVKVSKRDMRYLYILFPWAYSYLRSLKRPIPTIPVRPHTMDISAGGVPSRYVRRTPAGIGHPAIAGHPPINNPHHKGYQPKLF